MKVKILVSAPRDPKPMVAEYEDDRPVVDWREVQQIIGRWAEEISQLRGARISRFRATPSVLILPGDPEFEAGRR